MTIARAYFFTVSSVILIAPKVKFPNGYRNWRRKDKIHKNSSENLHIVPALYNCSALDTVVAPKKERTEFNLQFVLYSETKGVKETDNEMLRIRCAIYNGIYD